MAVISGRIYIYIASEPLASPPVLPAARSGEGSADVAARDEARVRRFTASRFAKGDDDIEGLAEGQTERPSTLSCMRACRCVRACTCML